VGPHDVRSAVQEEIQVVLETPALRGAGLADAVDRIGRRHGVEPFRTVLRALAGITLPETEARSTMLEIEDHRQSLVRALGRDPGLLVAALDRLHGIDRLPGDPVFESSRQEPTGVPMEANPGSTISDRLDDEVRRAERVRRPLSFALLSCRVGHEGAPFVRGEEVLRDAARDTDIVELLDDGGVAVVLPCIGPGDAVAAVERMRLVVADRSMRPWAAGLSSYPIPASDPAALVLQAQAALDEALRVGETSLIYREDRRAHPRRSIGNLLSASINEGGRETDVLVEDLSLGGARIVSDRRFLEGADIQLVLRETTARPRNALLVSRVLRVVEAPDPGSARSYRSAVSFVSAPSERMQLASVLADLPPAGSGPGRDAA